jgi:hypothetical protein
LVVLDVTLSLVFVQTLSGLERLQAVLALDAAGVDVVGLDVARQVPPVAAALAAGLADELAGLALDQGRDQFVQI